MPKGPQAVLRGFCFIPKLPPNQFWTAIKTSTGLGAFLRQFARKTVGDLVESSE